MSNQPTDREQEALEKARQIRRKKTRREYWTKMVLNLVLVGIAFTFSLPFVWMVLTSLKPLAEVGTGSWLPKTVQWSNYSKVFDVIPFARFYWNSIFVACWITFLQVVTASLAAFSFSRLEWPGRDKVFILYLATQMIPGLILIIPNYQIMVKLGLVDTFVGLVLPGAFTAYGTFLLRQFMMTIPRSLDEAAEIDGASKLQIYWHIILPMARPGIITLAIFTFLGAYRSFFWPLVMLKNQARYTLPIGLLSFSSSHGQSTHLLMAAVTMSVVPVILVFVFLQKRLVRGIQMGAVKG